MDGDADAPHIEVLLGGLLGAHEQAQLGLRQVADGKTITLDEIADRPTLPELMERLSHEPPAEVDEAPEVTIRRLRNSG